jgi:hypothetical protein
MCLSITWRVVVTQMQALDKRFVRVLACHGKVDRRMPIPAAILHLLPAHREECGRSHR